MNKKNRKVMETDVLIVGSEGAGSRAAIEIAKNGIRVLIVTKGVYTRCGATVTADMDMDVPSRDLKEVFGFPGVMEDDEESFCRDMCEEGKYMNNEEVVWAHCSNATKYVKELVDWGMKVEGCKQSAGHRYPRGILSTGRSMMEALKRGVKPHKIDFQENTMITDLLTSNGRVVGAVGIELHTGNFLVVKAKAVILATGGAMRIYPVTTAPQELTGDGMRMAFDVGAELVDMEFPMFLPACLYWPESMKGVDVSYIASAAINGWWFNAFGERFIDKWDPVRMEMGTTRDIASIAQAMEILEGRGSPHGGIYVSFKHLPDQLIEDWFNRVPYLRNFVYGNFKLIEFNMDPRKVAYEAGPAAHYWNGGIRINEKCETKVPGLYAAGEVQGGTMGANRLSGNAVTECVVFGGIAGENAAEYAQKSGPSEIDKAQVEHCYELIHAPLERKDGVNVPKTRERIQDLAMKYAGPVREEEGLLTLRKELEKIWKDDVPNVFAKAKNKVYNREWLEALEIEPMVEILTIITQASLMRKESRGAMYRRDYPDTDNKEWLKNIIVSYRDGKTSLEARDVNTSRVDLPKREKIPYMVPEWEWAQKGGA